MRFIEVKKQSDIKLNGITVDLDVVNETVKGITLRDTAGGILKVVESGYAISVQVPAPPKTEKRWRVAGSLLGIDMCKDFADQYEAKRERDRLVGGAPESDLKVEEVEVQIEE